MGYSCSIHSFATRGENYPLTKAMIDHDHDRIKTINWREVGDKVNREVLKEVGALKSKGSDGWDHRVG